MNGEALDLSERLAAELATNDADISRAEIEAEQDAPRLVDTRTIPARFHHLKEMARSPAHCLASFGSKYSADSLAMRIGSGTHAMLFGQPFAVFTGKQRRKGTEKKPSEWDLFSAQHAGKVIMNAREHAQAQAICAAIKSHEIASRLLFAPGVVHEETITFEQNGRTRRSTPDARGPFHLAELKSTRNAEAKAFCRDARYRFYHAQIADQSAAIEALTGKRPKEVYVIAVEQTWPHVVTVFQALDRALELGRNLCRDWLDRLLLAEETGLWPGYAEQVVPLEIWEDFGDDEEVDDDEWPDVFAAEGAAT